MSAMAKDFQRWAAASHANYDHYRSLWSSTPDSAFRNHAAAAAATWADARASDFKHSWRIRFGTTEVEPWA